MNYEKTSLVRIVKLYLINQGSLTNSRGSRVAVPKSRSRVQCRGRGSNVAAGENDLGFKG